MDDNDERELADIPADELLAMLKAERPDLVAAIIEQANRQRDAEQNEEIAQLREAIAYHNGYEAGKQQAANDRPTLFERIELSHQSNGAGGGSYLPKH